MKNLILFFFLTVSSCFAYGQKYKVAGYYKGKAAQGMAIYKNRSYLLNTSGYCRIFNLKKNKLISEFPLGCASEDNHANTASFGVESVGSNKVPVMYISECAGPEFRCFVENITNNGATLVQTIQARNGERIISAHDWIVDAENRFLYAVTRLSSTPNEEGTIEHRIRKYRLPLLSEGDSIVLTEKDILDQYEVAFLNILQGGKVYKGKMYLSVGLQSTASSSRIDSERAIIVIDLEEKRIVDKIVLTDIVNDEPEDIAFYRGKPYVFCGQSGGLHLIDIE